MPSIRALLVAFPLLAASAAFAANDARDDQVIKVTAKKFDFTPNLISVRLNVPVVLELTTLDRTHGFAVPELKLEAEIKPGEVTRLRFIPDKIGTFAFHCNRFCGTGHEDMNGQIVVTK